MFFIKESTFQKSLKKRLEEELPGCIILKTDAVAKPGFPDLLILYEQKWAAIEVKAFKNAWHQPNQDYYIDILNSMAFARFVHPENAEETVNYLKRYFTEE